MKKLLLRIQIFFFGTVRSWGHWLRQDTDDPRCTMGIDPFFEWKIAGILADFDDELSQWYEVQS